MARYGKVIFGKLVKFNSRKIHTLDGRTIVNPTREQLLENGYKLIIEEPQIQEGLFAIEDGFNELEESIQITYRYEVME